MSIYVFFSSVNCCFGWLSFFSYVNTHTLHNRAHPYHLHTQILLFISSASIYILFSLFSILFFVSVNFITNCPGYCISFCNVFFSVGCINFVIFFVAIFPFFQALLTKIIIWRFYMLNSYKYQMFNWPDNSHVFILYADV